MSFFKEKILELFKYQLICLFLLYFFSVLLTYKKTSPIISFISLVILALTIYICHIFVSLNIFKEYSPHLIFHHKENDKINNTYLFVEICVNISPFILFYFFNYYFLCGFVPNILIFYIMIIYISIHIINYSLLHVSHSHNLHHKYINCNFGPDFLDHIFGTNCDNQVENVDYFIPNVVFSFFLTWFVFKPKIF
jgi:hypothetical protein